MRAKVKRRQMYRRVTITVVVVAILVLLIVGFYIAYESSNSNAPADNKPVTPEDLSTLRQLSSAPYGPPSSSMLSMVKTINQLPLTAGGKPLVVYIGADYCMYCAAQRWSMVLALDRFGNLSGLEYMSSSPADGDYPTFTFESATYTSKYIAFQGFEEQDRNSQPLHSAPSNYSAVFTQYGGSAYPFLNFGNQYVISGALWSPTSLGSNDWSGVYSAVKSNSTLGTQIKAGANVITALICKLTNNKPATVCQQPPINTITLSVAAYSPPPPTGTVLVAEPALSFPGWLAQLEGVPRK
jgi:uncharacterized protein YneF (UPF0154 family)